MCIYLLKLKEVFGFKLMFKVMFMCARCAQCNVARACRCFSSSRRRTVPALLVRWPSAPASSCVPLCCSHLLAACSWRDLVPTGGVRRDHRGHSGASLSSSLTTMLRTTWTLRVQAQLRHRDCSHCGSCMPSCSCVHSWCFSESGLGRSLGSNFAMGGGVAAPASGPCGVSSVYAVQGAYASLSIGPSDA